MKYAVSGSSVDVSGSILTLDWIISVGLFTELDGSTRKRSISLYSTEVSYNRTSLKNKIKINQAFLNH